MPELEEWPPADLPGGSRIWAEKGGGQGSDGSEGGRGRLTMGLIHVQGLEAKSEEYNTVHVWWVLSYHQPLHSLSSPRSRKRTKAPPLQDPSSGYPSSGNGVVYRGTSLIRNRLSL